MVWHLIAAIFAGLGAAGIALMLRFLSGKRLPRWIIPAFAGLGMLAYQVYNEYSWLDHKQIQLPASAQVVTIEKERIIWRPWTFLFPMTTAFTVIDQDSLLSSRTNDERLVEFILYRFEKHYKDVVTHQVYLVNCTTQEKLPLMGEDRQPQISELHSLDASDPLFQAVCSG